MPDAIDRIVTPPVAPARIRWYPVLLATGWLLLNFLGLSVSPYAMLRTAVVVVVFAVALTVVGAVLLRDGRRGAVFAMIVLVVVIAGREPLFVAAGAIIVATLIVERYVGSSTPGFESWWVAVDRVARGATLIFLLAVAVTAIQGGQVPRMVRDLVAEFPLRPGSRPVASVGDELPDIYLVLVDGYARADTLREMFALDNAPFLGGLEARGFDVASDSRATYLLTALSLSSLLEMRLLADVPVIQQARADGASEEQAFRLLINESEVFDLLRDRGYTIVANSSGYEHVTIRGADRFEDAGTLNEVEMILLGYRTAVGGWLDAIRPGILGEQMRTRLDSSFDFAAREAERAATDGPKLVITHVPGPHPPLVVNAEGQTVPLGITDLRRETWPYGNPTRASALERFRDETVYVNDRLLPMVDDILAASPEPPIIVLFSDHGTDVHLDWDELDPAASDERTGNLFASFTPGHDDLFGDAPTLVNTMPTLFNAYFGTTLPLSPDVSVVWNGRFDSQEVVLGPAD